MPLRTSWAAGLALAIALGGCAIPFHRTTSNTGPLNSGAIDFGARYATNPLRVEQPRSTFKPGDTIAWVAHLSANAGTKTLTRIFLRAGKGGNLSVVRQSTVTVSDPKDNVLALQLPVSALSSEGVTAPGTYTLRYARGSTVLAQGGFTLTR